MSFNLTLNGFKSEIVADIILFIHSIMPISFVYSMINQSCCPRHGMAITMPQPNMWRLLPKSLNSYSPTL